jgi:L-ascorbate metabolism protein UlaG (beta-lactamase superfamily)
MPRNRFYDRNKDHHTLRGFQNSEPIEFKQSDILKWRQDRALKKYPHPPKGGYKAFIEQWWQPADFNVDDDAIWWLGHSTVLFKIGEQTILTDPVFSQRVSPITFAGPIRQTPPPTTIAQLPPIDIVMISHDHYDHLDLPSIKALIKRFPNIQFLVPLGLKLLIKQQITHNIAEMDWWDNRQIGDSLFTFVPAKHWSARGLLDRNSSLWGGWVINNDQRNFYFMGDTGYSTQLHEIPQRLGNIDFAVIPIGAYAPRWFMQAQHIDPAQAVQLHQELNCQRSLAVHWGTFELADEPLDEPPTLLHRILEKKRLSPASFNAIKIGDHLPL